MHGVIMLYYIVLYVTVLINYILAGQENYISDNFFIKHRNTIGNSRWMAIRFGTFWLLYTTFHLIFMELLWEVDEIMVTSIFVAGFCVVLIIYRKFPKLYDNFAIRNELYRTMMLVTFLVVSYIPCWILLFITDLPISGLVGKGYQLGYLFGLLYILVIYVIKQNSKNINSSSNKNNDNNDITLKQVLENKDCYQLFMKFLVTYVVLVSSMFVLNFGLFCCL